MTGLEGYYLGLLLGWWSAVFFVALYKYHQPGEGTN